MATSAVVQAALAAAVDLDWADLAKLLKQAIVNAIVSSSGEVALPWTATGSDGTSITRLSLQEATDLHARFASMATGGVVSQYVEFRT